MNILEAIEYDTAEGLREHLGSLDDLHLVLDARHEAGYDRHERLDNWCLLGRFALDTCGNTGKYIGDQRSIIPAEVDPLIEDVLPQAILTPTMQRILDNKPGLSIIIDCSNPNIPTSHVKCVECDNDWTVRNSHDADGFFDSEPMSLHPYVGETILAVNEDLANARTRDGVRSFTPSEWSVRQIGVTDERGREWRKVRSDHIIQEGEDGRVNVHRFIHPKCRVEKIARVTRDKFEATLEEAGFEEFEVQPVPNQYGEGDSPWFRVTTKNGKPILIGWRRRVIDIRWLEQDFSGSITGEDEVTESTTNAHAWGYKKASEYLQRLRAELSA